MTSGPSLLSVLTVVGLLAVASGVVVRAIAVRQSLLVSPGPARLGLPRDGCGWVSIAIGGAWRSVSARRRIRPGSPAPVVEPELPPIRWTFVTPGRALFVGCFAVYAAVGGILALHFHSFNGDAQARLANAYYVMFSRDPHLAAIGFVWNPLPSLLLMPLLPLKAVWPALTKQAFAANLESALFMAGAVCALRGILYDLRVPRLASGVVLVAFAANPMILYYGANGMSEALFLLTLLLATRHLMRWLATGTLRGLALCGVCLAVAYMARSEAVAAGMSVIALVAGRTFLIAPAAPRRERLMAAAADGIIVGVPVITAFVGWAITSFIITGHPFEQFSSEYGNASQLRVIGGGLTESLGMSRPTYMAVQLMSYAPLLPVIGLAGAALCRRARDPRGMAALAVLGGVLSFAVLGYVAGQTAGWYRYTIVAVPLAPLLMACLLAGGGVPLHPVVRRPALARPVALAGFAALLLAPAIPATAWAMANPEIGREERQHLGWVLRGAKTQGDRDERGRLRVTQAIARHLDALDLPAGSVVMDTFSPCVPWIVIASARPRQFVITNDRDFEAVLSDPRVHEARYLLLPPNRGYGSLDAINRAYPGLYEEGAGLARLDHEFDQTSCPAFRLYEVTGSPVGETRVVPRGAR